MLLFHLIFAFYELFIYALSHINNAIYCRSGSNDSHRKRLTDRNYLPLEYIHVARDKCDNDKIFFFPLGFRDGKSYFTTKQIHVNLCAVGLLFIIQWQVCSRGLIFVLNTHCWKDLWGPEAFQDSKSLSSKQVCNYEWSEVCKIGTGAHPITV